ncbi:hypothetical protein K7X08_027666 [Anisodus acutangulus]|uniref:Uncharacterized protein n=1 Tax=Anisodus acutangulus TaxID=402998 RepID=A0A9Q1LMV7_9SOLA|nr:hypothetical protein K7X08_027666 [Anisodus acutangulus]
MSLHVLHKQPPKPKATESSVVHIDEDEGESTNAKDVRGPSPDAVAGLGDLLVPACSGGSENQPEDVGIGDDQPDEVRGGENSPDDVGIPSKAIYSIFRKEYLELWELKE